MSLFIGIDGGGTKTKCVVVDDNLNIISEAEDNATNPFVVGFDESAKKFLTHADYPPEIGAALIAIKNFNIPIILKN